MAGSPNASGATVIAADKTGTLTVNQLCIVAVQPEARRSEHEVLTAGAPTLIERSRLSEQRKRELLTEAMNWAGDGLRVLAVRERELGDEAPGEDELDCELELLGLVGLRDPLRPRSGPQRGDPDGDGCERRRSSAPRTSDPEPRSRTAARDRDRRALFITSLLVRSSPDWLAGRAADRRRYGTVLRLSRRATASCWSRARARTPRRARPSGRRARGRRPRAAGPA